jgi:hypothetical protein
MRQAITRASLVQAHLNSLHTSATIMSGDRPALDLRPLSRQEVTQILDRALRWAGVRDLDAAETVALYLELSGFVVMKRSPTATWSHGMSLDQHSVTGRLSIAKHFEPRKQLGRGRARQQHFGQERLSDE